jgi:hypothetical protein
MKDNNFFYAVLFLTLLSLVACTDPSSSDLSENTTTPFSVKDPNYIYFKNMRSYYYAESLAPGGKPSQRMNIYQLRKFSEIKDYPLIIPRIIDNWFEDEAYLFLEANEYPLASPLTLYAVEGQDTSILKLERPSPEAQWAMAQDIEVILEQERPLLVLNNNGEREPIFTQKADRLAFLTTMKDFRRLTE